MEQGTQPGGQSVAVKLSDDVSVLGSDVQGWAVESPAFVDLKPHWTRSFHLGQGSRPAPVV